MRRSVAGDQETYLSCRRDSRDTGRNHTLHIYWGEVDKANEENDMTTFESWNAYTIGKP